MTMYYSLPDNITPNGEIPPKENTVVFTGHRKFINKDWAVHKLRMTIDLAAQRGLTHFISGAALGTDQIAARLVLSYPKTECELTLAIPFPGQPDRWPLHLSKKYYELLDLAHNIVLVNGEPPFDNGWKIAKCYLTRNQWMVDNSGLCIAVWDGRTGGGTMHAMTAALRSGLKVYTINPKRKECGWWHVEEL